MGKLRYTELSGNPKALLAHTGLKPAEFETLCHVFDDCWKQYSKYNTLEGKPRVRQNRSRKNEILPTSEDKLLFVLYYLKTNPLQEVLASAFGMYQPHASAWLKRLLPRLEEALAETDSLPERHSERLYRAVLDQDTVLIDGTERPIQRSVDNATQREHFSGKKSVI